MTFRQPEEAFEGKRKSSFFLDVSIKDNNPPEGGTIYCTSTFILRNSILVQISGDSHDATVERVELG